MWRQADAIPPLAELAAIVACALHFRKPEMRAARQALRVRWRARLAVAVALVALVIAAPVTRSALAQGEPGGPIYAAAAAAAPGAAPSVSADLLPRQLSFTGMIRDADWVVKCVMAGLAFASLVTWTVFFVKAYELLKANQELRHAMRVLQNAPTLMQADQALGNNNTAVGRLLRETNREIALSANGGNGVNREGLKERIALQLERLEHAVTRKISLGTGALATISSTAPFVGLFGTVWGIMNSFIGISNAHTTNLAVVAPGIAQALLATAFGLFAAIPAVMIYNLLARLTANYRSQLGDASAQILRLVSRDLDQTNLRVLQAAE